MNTDLRQVLENTKSIAVYGMSNSILKPAFTIPSYMKNQGFEIIPINPKADEILKLKVYRNIDDIPDYIDMLNVFRPSDECEEVVKKAIKRKEKMGDINTIWLQLGIKNEKAKALAKDAGITFIQDKCIYVEHINLARVTDSRQRISNRVGA